MTKRGRLIWAIVVLTNVGGFCSLNADRSFLSETTAEVELIAEPAPQPAPPNNAQQQKNAKDSIKLQSPVAKTIPRDYEEAVKKYPADLRQPANIGNEFEYDPKTNTYILHTKIGDSDVETPISLTPEQYFQYSSEKSMQSYFRKKNEEEFENQLNGKGSDAFDVFNMQFDLGPADKIFGPGGVKLTSQGSATIKMAINRTVTDNPTLPENLRKKTSFDFDEQIQATINASVGDKVNFGMNYNTETTFDFDSKKIKLAYKGKEDEIIKNLEAGNVSMTTSNSLIRGGTSLFGFKTELQFGKLRVNALFSQQESESKTVTANQGAQTTPFEISADQYDEYRHYFLSKYFLAQYDTAMSALPYVKSGISITRIEVWITNSRSNYDEARNLVAFSDLAEVDSIRNKTKVTPTPGTLPIPYNNANDLYKNMVADASVRDINQVNQSLSNLGYVGGVDYEKLSNARKLSESEYTLNAQLGYISLRNMLKTDEVLAVAYQYTYRGQTYQVGEFSTDNSSGDQTKENLYLKLLKGTSFTPQSPYWHLMMRNIYSLNAYSLQRDKFRLDIMYLSDTTGTYMNYLTEGAVANQPLLRVMGLDRLNSQQNPYPDGFFDYLEGYTVMSQNGKIIFPVVEPFGSHLRKKIGNDAIADNYVFQELYDSTLTVARQIAEKNKFVLTGEYKGSAGSEINLEGMNVPRGSVRVTANGVVLQENIDYTVDYASGKVNVINPAYENVPINITSENRSNFAMQRKTMMGLDLQYQFNPDFSIGGTIMNLSEMPITMKVNPGDESINNTIYGFNVNYKTKSQWLTNLVDKLPLIELTQPSSISFNAEFAQLIPGHYQSEYGGDYSYVDDFERAKVKVDLRYAPYWFLASTPDYRFPEAREVNNALYGNNRAMFAWYTIDPLFTRKNSSLTPTHIKNDKEQLSNHYVREVYEMELFPNKELAQGEAATIPVLNIAYYPNERGPYNVDGDSINPNDGTFLHPERKWGGMMRSIDQGYRDFEAANIEYIEFWLLDPFIYDANKPNIGGDLYFNLGEISEDILKDERKFFENGLPVNGDTTAFEKTVWGKVPTRQSLNYAFDNTDPNNNTRRLQDVGLNGLTKEEEKSFGIYKNLIDTLEKTLSGNVLSQMKEDQFSPFNSPSGDIYHYYRGSDFDQMETSILDRYKHYNGTEGNSASAEDSPENYNTAAKNSPDVEDINQDNTLSENERYFEYKVSLRPKDMEVGKGYIVDRRDARVSLRNGTVDTVTWYLYKVPLRDNKEKIAYGNISDFKTIRFIRTYLTNCTDTMLLRFGTFELVKGDWRAYTQPLYNPNQPPINSNTTMNIATVNLEENGDREPVNYVMPPGVNRIIDPSQAQIRQENEQSLSMLVANLSPNDARAVYKNTALDTRQYRRLQMFTHAEALINDPTNLQNDEISIFLRLGSDYKNNYYEYEIPLNLTPAGRYSDGSSSDRLAVWPKENMFDFPFEALTNLKLSRNREKRKAGSNVTYGTIYSENDPDKPMNKISIVGNPSISEIKVIMIGVRNNSRATKSAIIWVDELRLTDFNEDGGWAANGNLNITLSDLGMVNLAGNVQTAGFGTLEQGIMERNMDDRYGYNVATTIELGKLFPEKANVSLPFSYGYSEQIVSPKYDPLNQDILLKDALDAAQTKAEKDSIRNYAQDKVINKNIGLNNIKVNIKSKNPMPYDPANFTLGYSFSEQYKQNATTEYERNTDTRLFFGYAYSPYVQPWAPFKDIKSKSGAVKFAKEFKLNYLPNTLAFSSDMARSYYELQLKDLNMYSTQNMVKPAFREDFFWNRGGNIQWNLTPNLNLRMETGTKARIETPYVQVNKQLYPDEYQIWKDSVWQSIRDLGTPISYAQSFSATYSIPFKFIPILDWMGANLSYNAAYNWDKGATQFNDPDIEVGNTIRNQRSIGLDNANLNLLNFYNKNTFLKNVNQKFNMKKPTASNARSVPKNQQKPAPKEKKKYEGSVTLSQDSATIVKHQLNNKRVRVTARGADGRLYLVNFKAIDNNTVRINNKDTARLTLAITQLPPPEEDLWYKIAQVGARGLMTVRTIGFTYKTSTETMVPNFRPDIGDFLGQGNGAPGWDFAFGLTDEGYINTANERGWLINDTINNTIPAMFNRIEDISFRATLEPFTGMKIDLTASRNNTRREELYYMFTDISKRYGGSFNMTTIAIGSAFESRNANNGYYSKAFSQFLNNRAIIKNRLQKPYNNSFYPDGTPYNPTQGVYSENSADVLIPAFLAAYTGKDPNTISLTAFPSLASILPNWNVRYEGLMQWDIINKHFKTFELKHRYDCRYLVGTYTSYMDWVSNSEGIGFIRNITTDNWVPSMPYSISTVNITENFNPLFGVDATFKSNVSAKLELRKTRNLNLNISSYQIVETASNEYVIGAGYRFTDFNKVLKMKASQGVSHDLLVSADFSYKQMQTLIRKIQDVYTQATSGDANTMIKLSGKYNLSKSLTVEAFYDKQISKPLVSSTAFPISKSSFGISVNLSLSR